MAARRLPAASRSARLTLNRNVTDYHTEIEQAAFEPNNIVPGTGLSPDKMLLARGFSYADAHRARLGVNYKQIPVNAPKVAGAQLLQGRRDADPQRHRPGVRAELRWAARQADTRARGRGALACRRRHGARRVHAAAGGRRLGPGRHRWCARCWTTPRATGWSTTSSAICSDGVSEPILSRAFEYWRNVDKDLGDRIEPASAPKAVSTRRSLTRPHTT